MFPDSWKQGFKYRQIPICIGKINFNIEVPSMQLAYNVNIAYISGTNYMIEVLTI